MFPDFTTRTAVAADGTRLNLRVGGSGPPLLLLHGHPQTQAIWHRVASALAARHTLVLMDLRGYGDSGKPPGIADHANYSKRTMAADALAAMAICGFDRFAVLAHDRGARVAHRLCADHPAAVERALLLDVAPTLAMYRQTGEAFARGYWHWFFLIQPAPLPERLIAADPAAYVHDVIGRRSAGLTPFDPRALAEYVRCAALPGTAHGICEDYRASAGIDLVHDQQDRDRGHRLTQPLLVLWGMNGIIQRCFRPLDEWRQVADDVRGEALPCGHYIPEEAPETLAERALDFFSGR
ncbi:MAG: alpha/beta fold hydrolase [Lautropia sp.]